MSTGGDDVVLEAFSKYQKQYSELMKGLEVRGVFLVQRKDGTVGGSCCWCKRMDGWFELELT